MKVIIAPDKFKGSCSADRVARAIERGWRAVFPQDETVTAPAADGGDGTLDAVRAACGGTFVALTAAGPLGKPVETGWLMLPDGTAVVEMARVSGLALIGREERDVRRADTYGTGQLMRDALDRGCRRFVVGVGGSATNDGGMGMLRALGARFLGADGELTLPGELDRLESIDWSRFDKRAKHCDIIVASDVTNPLCGPDGASAVFGPQKGAMPEDVRHMDNCLRRLAEVAAARTGGDMGTNPGCMGEQWPQAMASPGAGAAGGLGWALTACMGARIEPGIDVVLDAARFDALLSGAGLVITGEGSLDGQTAMGKVPVGVARRAAGRGIPVAAVAGRLVPGYEAVYDMGVDCAVSIAPGPISLEEAMGRAEELIEQAALRLARSIGVGRRVGKVK